MRSVALVIDPEFCMNVGRYTCSHYVQHKYFIGEFYIAHFLLKRLKYLLRARHIFCFRWIAIIFVFLFSFFLSALKSIKLLLFHWLKINIVKWVIPANVIEIVDEVFIFILIVSIKIKIEILVFCKGTFIDCCLAQQAFFWILFQST